MKLDEMSGSASEISILELRENRIQRIEKQILDIAKSDIEFNFNPQGTNLYSIEETKRSYAKRIISLKDASISLLNDKKYVAASIIGRAIIETVAMGALFMDEIERLIRAGNAENFENKILRFIVGGSGSDQKPVHVNDALRHLEKLDQEYFDYLWKRHPLLKSIYQKIMDRTDGDLDASDAYSVISAIKNYDFLSEFAHPNGLGTQFIFPSDDNETDTVKLLRQKLAYQARAAVWQGHHFVSAYQRAETSSENYRTKFMS